MNPEKNWLMTRKKKSVSGVGRDARYLCQGHDSDETEREPECSIPVEIVRDEAERDEHEQDVRPSAKKEIFVRLNPPGSALRDAK